MMAIPTNRIHVATADGFITDPDGNAVVLYGADARSPKGDASYWREIADVVAYRLSDGEYMNLSEVRVKGLSSPREMGRIEVKVSPHDEHVMASGTFGFSGESMSDTASGRRLLSAVARFYDSHPELTAPLSADEVRASHLRDATSRVRIPSEAYHAGREYLTAGGDRETLRAAMLAELTCRVEEAW